MNRAVLAVLALVGLLAMHGMSAQHEPMPTHVVHMTTTQAAEPIHDHDAMSELCFAVLTGLVGLLLLAIGARKLVHRVDVELAAQQLVPSASARASPRRPPSISELCVLRT